MNDATKSQCADYIFVIIDENSVKIDRQFSSQAGISWGQILGEHRFSRGLSGLSQFPKIQPPPLSPKPLVWMGDHILSLKQCIPFSQLPALAATVTGEFPSSFTMFKSAPLSISISTTFTYPIEISTKNIFTYDFFQYVQQLILQTR